MCTITFLVKNKIQSTLKRFYREIFTFSILLFLSSLSITHATTINVADPQNPVSTNWITGYMVYGQGRQLCGSYLQAVQMAKSKNYLQLNYFRHWMAGYMSGYNLFYQNANSANSSIAGRGDEAEIENQLSHYCQNNSEKEFASAAATVILNLKANR